MRLNWLRRATRRLPVPRHSYPSSWLKRCAAAVCLVGLLGLACDDVSKTAGPGANKPAAGTPPGGAAAADVPPAPRPTAQPRPADAGPYTWHDYYEDALAFNRWTLVGAYRDVGHHGAWDAAAERFLHRLAVHLTGSEVKPSYRPADFPSQKDLIAEVEALVASGCTDPIVAYFNGALRQDAGDAAGAAQLVEQGGLEVIDSDYPAFRKLAAVKRGRRVSQHSKFFTAETLDAAVIQGPLSNIERRQVLDLLSELYADRPPDTLLRPLERLRKVEGADEWVLDVLTGRAHVTMAWAARGSGWADSVTDEGWRTFFQHLTLARDHLTRAWKAVPELPEAPNSMITVAMGGGERLRENPMTWFERAEQAQFDYTPAYSSMIGGPLLPRWGGSHQAMYTLGLRAAKTKRFDTEVPRELLGAVTAIVNDAGGSWEILSQPGVYEELSAVLDGYASQPGRPQQAADWDRSLRAAIAWRAGRLDESRRTLDELGDRVQPAAFEAWFAKAPQAAIGNIYALTSKEAARVTRAEAAMKARKFDAALKEFRAARDALAADAATAAATRAYFDTRIGVLERRATLAKGDWVDVQPPSGLAGWNALAGRWSAGADKAILAEANAQLTPCLLLEEDLGPRYEISGRVERLGSGPRAAGLVLAAGKTPLGFVMFTGSGVEVNHQGKVVHRAAAPIGEQVEFVCRFDNGKLSVSVGGSQVVSAYAMPRGYAVDPHVGLAVPPRISARFSGLRVRKLTDAAGRVAATGGPDEGT